VGRCREVLERTSWPGVYRRGSRYVVVYRADGRQRMEAVATLALARELKLRRAAVEGRAAARPDAALVRDWVVRSLRGQRHDTVSERTRAEYRRLLATFALRYFDERVRLRDLDRRTLGAFVTWLTRHSGPDGLLCDRSIRNALTPLRGCLRAAHAEGLVDSDLCEQLVLPRRRGGKPHQFVERRFLTRDELARLLTEIPIAWRPFFDLLAVTGLRISEAIALRVMDLDAQLPAVRVRRAIVDGQLTIPKSRYGLRTVPIPPRLAAELSHLAAMRQGGEDLLFRGPQGGPVRPNNLRQRVLVPAAERAGVPWARFHTLRHTCASLLAEAGAGPIRLQRWMGHHSAGFTLDTYGHLIDGDLGPGLDLSVELTAPTSR
jgi:integrase